MTPLFTDAKNGVYLLAWEDDHISIRVDRLVEDSKHVVSGEITIREHTTDRPRHIHQTRINFTSTGGKGGLRKELEGLWPSFDWKEAIEYTSVKVLEAYREGEPVFRVSDIPPSEAVAYRVRPFVMEGKANMMFGPGGILKSYMGLYWSILVDTALGVGVEPECEPGTVLYLDYETDQDDFRRRVEYIQRGLGIQDANDSSILYRFCTHPLSSDIVHIQQVVAEENVDLVVVDSAGPACGGDLESARDVLRFFAALRSLRTSSLIIGHTQKNADSKTPLGSGYWTNMPRNIWQVKGSQEDDSSEATVVFSDFKRNSRDRMRPLAYRANFMGDALSIQPIEASVIPEAVESMTLGSRIKLLLADGKRTCPDIAHSLGAKEDMVRLTLNRGRDKGFVKLGESWGLLTIS